jgi:SAM-dependent methyltransferase
MTADAIPLPATEGEAYDAWAPWYDVADADRAPFIGFYTGLVDAGTASIVELGCGTGTLLAAVADRAAAVRGAPARVIGLDLSQGMLAIARRRFPAFEFVHGDVRAPAIPGRHDLVFSGFNTLQHLPTTDDLVAALAAARALLADGGRFAFDVYQPNLDWLRSRAPDRMARALHDAHGRALQIREDAAYDEATRILSLDWRLVDAAAPAGPPIAATHYRLRQHFADEVEAAIAAAGLRIAARFGDFDRSAFGPASRKQVLVCVAA